MWQLVANPAHQCHHNNNVSLNHIYCTLLSSCLKTSMFHTHDISQPLPLNVAHPAQFRPTLRTCTACRGAVRYTPRCERHLPYVVCMPYVGVQCVVQHVAERHLPYVVCVCVCVCACVQNGGCGTLYSHTASCAASPEICCAYRR